MRNPNQLPRVGPTSMYEMWVRRVRTMATKKGLETRKVEGGNWVVVCPNGLLYNAVDVSDMMRFVKGY